MDKTGSSIRFFIAGLMSIGMLVVALSIYERSAQQVVDGMKEQYEQMGRQNIFLKEQMNAAIEAQSSKQGYLRICFIVALIILLLSWLAMLRIARSAQDKVVQLNRTLEQRVKERTDSLAQALEELQKVQSQLLQSEKFSAVGQLAAGIAHEINNPVGFINSNLQTLEKYFIHYKQLLGILNQLGEALKNKDKEQVAGIILSWEKIRTETNFTFMDGDIGNLLKESQEGIEKIAKIVSDLCTLSSPDKGVVDAVNLEALMESMVNITWNELKYKVQLRKEYTQVPLVICNPQKIGQVFVNLLINASQAIKDKGFIKLKTYMKDKFVCLDVSDTGCGIAPENMTRIFDLFFTTKPVGRGLGLSISYDIIRRHGGSITFSSKAEEGTTFTVMLPAADTYDAAQL